MAILKTYPLKNNYYGSDRLILSDMQPDDQGVVHGTTKSLTLSSLKSFIGTGSDAFTLTTTGTSGAATFNTNTKILNIPDYSVGNIDGSGTASYMAKWTDSNTIGIGAIYDNAGDIGIGTTTTDSILTVKAATANVGVPVIKTSVDGFANGFTLIGDNYIAGESQFNLGISYSGSNGVLSRGVKVSNTTDDVFLSSQDAYSSNPNAFILGRDGSFRFLNTSTNASTPVGTAVSLSERMRILSNGNVGIGTTTPNYKLDVDGDLSAKGITSSPTHTVTIEATVGWYRIMKWSGASRGGATVKLSTTGGVAAPTTYVINAYKTWGDPASTNTLKLEQYGNNGYITKARIATDSVTNVTYVEIYNTYTTANYTMEVYHDSLLGLDSLTSVLTGTLETGPNSVSQDELPFQIEGTTTEKSSSELVTLIGDGTNDGKLRFNCSANSHYVEVVGPTHSGGSSYSLKLPNSLPSVSNQILESNGAGALSWIPTPTGGGGGGGTVTSVGITMPPAFSVGNSPITGSGNISVGVTGGSAGQYLDYQGNWSTPTQGLTSVGLSAPPAFSVTGSPLTSNGSISIGVTGGLSGEFLAYNGQWATPTDNNTNVANSNLQLDNNRTLDLSNGDAAYYGLAFISTLGGVSKNLFKFDQIAGTSPRFTVGHTESAYEGYIVLEGNGSNRTGILQFENAAGTYYTSIKAPTTFGANQNIAYTLPNLQGSANSVLTNNGSGTLSWGSATEEASWTPTSANANTISNASGKYTKVGNTVFASFAFTMTGTTSVALSGLPFSGVYTSDNKGTSIISVNNCASVQGQLVGGQMATATSFIFNAYIGAGAGLPTKLQTTTSSLYQTSGGTYAGIIIYQTS